MVKQISRQHRIYDEDGLHVIELMEIALAHPVWFGVICWLINCNLNERTIKWILKKIIS
jgi:hypothetical protein